MPRQFLTVACTLELEEKLLDALGGPAAGAAFSSVATFARRSDSEPLSSAEQVLGRSRAVELHAALDEEQVAAVLAALRQQFSGKGVRYRTTPIIEEGVIE